MNVCVIITAAGRGRRFGEQDKLAQDLGGRPLLVRTVELFTKLPQVRSIVVAGPVDPPEAFAEFRNRYGPTLAFHGARIVEGGKRERWESVRNALAAVGEDVTHIAVHDAARPAADAALLARVFDAASTLSAVVPVVPIHATVKRLAAVEQALEGDEFDALADLVLGDAGKRTISARAIAETIDREGLVEVQTPQIFEAALLRRAYAQEHLEGATDDASLVERLGETVWTVEGDPRNIKVTAPADLPLVRAILRLDPPAQRPVHHQF